MKNYHELSVSDVKNIRDLAQKSIEIKTYKNKKSSGKIQDFIGLTLKAGSEDRPNAKYDETYNCGLPLSKLSAVKPKQFAKHYAKDENEVFLIFGHDKIARKKARKAIQKKAASGEIKEKKAERLLNALPQGYDYDYFEIYFISKVDDVFRLDTLVTGKVNYDTYTDKNEEGEEVVLKRRYLNPDKVYNGKTELVLGKTKDITELKKLSDSIIGKFSS